MFIVEQTDVFRRWFAALRDPVAVKQIAKRIVFAEAGHFGDAVGVGGRVTELRIHTGPGYRLYVTHTGQRLVVLLIGGTKDSQARDIVEAWALAKDLHNEAH